MEGLPFLVEEAGVVDRPLVGEVGVVLHFLVGEVALPFLVVEVVVGDPHTAQVGQNLLKVFSQKKSPNVYHTPHIMKR